MEKIDIKEIEEVTATPFEVKLIPEVEHKTNFVAFLKALDLFGWKHQLPLAPRLVQTPHRVPKPWVPRKSAPAFGTASRA